MHITAIEALQLKMFDKFQMYITTHIDTGHLRWLISEQSLKTLQACYAPMEFNTILGISFIPIHAESGYVELVDTFTNQVISK